ncbi:IS3 family transposase [Lactiplantibacillus plantarum]|uniref:IS3 family transposase n=1 Tax=Lactiplantibacillus plantarum TaxID=1590 RepID=UPI00227A511B|nr:IS3 family transposase [Lactiplantibacillus plantarum]WAI60032.1 IS3 family transposase [Lactiplantibacillus plantarum]
MKVSRAAYYKWIHRTPSKRALEDKEILKYVKIIEEENEYTLGVRRLMMNLHCDTTYRTSAGKMRRIMRENGIVAWTRFFSLTAMIVSSPFFCYYHYTTF